MCITVIVTEVLSSPQYYLFNINVHYWDELLHSSWPVGRSWPLWYQLGPGRSQTTSTPETELWSVYYTTGTCRTEVERHVQNKNMEPIEKKIINKRLEHEQCHLLVEVTLFLPHSFNLVLGVLPCLHIAVPNMTNKMAQLSERQVWQFNCTTKRRVNMYTLQYFDWSSHRTLTQ